MQNNQERQDGYFIQNILSGPLVICDPPYLKNGLHLDALQPGEVVDLSCYDTQALRSSAALRNALSNGCADELTEAEYFEQIEIADEREMRLSQEMRQRIVETEAAGNVYEAEQISIMAPGNPHDGYASEAIYAQKNNAQNQKKWAAEYRQAKALGIVRDPVHFAELVANGQIATQLGSRGRKVSLANDMTNHGAQDQLTMTATKATIAMPGAYQVKNEYGEREEMGGVYTEKRTLTNFNSTGQMVGANTIGVADSPSYPNYPMQKQAAPNNLYVEDGFVEDINLEQDDSEYEQNYQAQVQNVSNRFAPAPKSPYIGQAVNRPIGRRS